MTTDEDPLPLDDPDYRQAMESLIVAVNGFVYPGDRLEAVVGTVKALRSRPDLARLLLEDQ